MKRIWSLLMCITLLCALFIGCSDNHDNELQPPLSSKDCEGMPYQEVVDVFENGGFTNVEIEVIDDLVFGILTKDGEVESVTIDDDDSFSTDSWFSADSVVRVSYHTFTEESLDIEMTDTDPDDTSDIQSVIGSETEIKEPTDEPDDTIASPSQTEALLDPENSSFSIHFIDVGQADAALVECDGHYMLIDGGNKEDSQTIYSVLKNTGVEKLSIIVGTHGHEDHIGGLPGAYNYTAADMTLCPVNSYDSDAFEDFKRYADQKGGGITIPTVGDTYSLGSSTVKILGVNGSSDANNTSIVLMITYGETSFLFTGDAEREAEQVILGSGVDLSATVLKVGHHGSETSTTYPFLREIMPAYAVISVGDGNSYGHPTEDTLSRLRDADVQVFRTDLQGDIFCTSDGKTVSFSVEKNKDADTLAPAIVATPEPEPESVPEPVPEPEPVGTNYILNTNTKKFHYPSCGSVNRMKESNKQYYTGTRDNIIAMGYSPCGNCHP